MLPSLCEHCNKSDSIHVKKGGSRTEESTTIFEKEGWKTISGTVEKRKDEKLLWRIRGCDLFACEARYHPSCRKKYTIKPKH